MSGMSTFKEYASYYELIYADKDYATEAAFVHQVIRDVHPGACSLLNFGCGTGGHDRWLVRNGFSLCGVDISDEMLQAALSNMEPGSSLCYLKGDMRSIRIGKTYDAVLSLFHAMSYQVANVDVNAAFATALAHLKPGGVFLFDVWYGPCVLSIGAQTRVKEVEDERIKVTRIAQPVLRASDNVVEVNYIVFVKDKTCGDVHEIRETHCMRYFFVPEIRLLCSEFGFDIISAKEWLSGKELDGETWGACFLLKRK
jgi:SAM-dependent methyltransferase